MLKLAVFAVLLSLSLARDINQAGLDIIKQFEGFVDHFYDDGTGVRTIGYGHSCAAHDCSSIHPPISRAFGEQLLRQDLATYQNCVNNKGLSLNDNQFSALVSFTFNVGCGAFGSSTMLSYLRQSNYQAAADEFPKWVYGGGRVLPGLVKRRKAERALFLRDGPGPDPKPDQCTCCKGNALGEFCGHELCGNCEQQHIYGCNQKGASPSIHYGNCRNGCTGSSNSHAHCN